MQTSYKIDRDTRTLILMYIRNYVKYKSWYENERSKILGAKARELSGMPHGSGMTDPTMESAASLEKLDKHHRVHVLRAIDGAKLLIGDDIPDERQRQALKRSIWQSCENGRRYPYEAICGGMACSRRSFYRLKNEFLNVIKNNLGL